MGMAIREWLFSFRIPWLVLGLLSIVSVQQAKCLCSLTESEALLVLSGNNQSNAFPSWKRGTDCCRGWAGVTCDSNATHVVALNLTGSLQLPTGNISNSICSLYELQVLNVSISSGGLTDYLNVPACLWNMTEMRYLSISSLLGISLPGSLPVQICNLRNLTHLDMSGIQFYGPRVLSPVTGDVLPPTEDVLPPDCLWGMTQLEYLFLTTYQDSEPISSQVCNLQNLTHLEVQNLASGFLSFPSCLWKMSKIEFLRISGYTLGISLDVCKIPDITNLDLHGCDVYGDIPLCIWNLTRLESLSLAALNLRLRGSFSSDMCNVRNLSHLDLELSSADGYLPDCLWNMTRLEVLRVQGAGTKLQLPGSFSSQMCSLSNLRVLDISSRLSAVSGVLPACMWRMTQLQYIDLSGSDLSNMEYPTEVSAPSLEGLFLDFTNVNAAFLNTIGKLSALTTLTLSGNNITSLPDSIHNLSRLETLDASSNLITKLPGWISNMSLLGVLNMSSNHISDIPGGLVNLPMLSSLDLSSNQLREISLSAIEGTLALSLDSANLDSLDLVLVLDFSHNYLEKLTMTGFSLSVLGLSENLISEREVDLSHSRIDLLDLSNNHIQSIPKGMLNGSIVTSVWLSENPLQNFNVSGLCDLLGLTTLALSNVSGDSSDLKTVFASLGCPSKLEYLSLSGNNIFIDPATLLAGHFPNLTRLSGIDLSNNNISCDLTSLMASLFQNRTQLSWLNLSNNTISGDLSWFSGGAPELSTLEVSRNQLSGELPRALLTPLSSSSGTFGRYLQVSNNRLGGHVPEPDGGDGWNLDVSWNQFEGPLPPFHTATFDGLVVSGNNFTGPIPSSLNRSTGIRILDMSHNKFSGEVPAFLGNLQDLEVLDLTSNDLNGSLPRELGDFGALQPRLQHLRLCYNSLRGQIPGSIGNIWSLLSFTITHNHLEGPVPLTFGNLVNLALLDVSHNNLSGTLSLTLESLSASLRVFSVASNHLSGFFPAWLVSSNFTSLQVLDLSDNDFDGDLPMAYSSLSGFINVTSNGTKDMLYTDGVQISAKGLDSLSFTYFLTVTTSFDVSSNKFSGSIPRDLSELRALRYLKLSGNNFSGNIPAELSNLGDLESLDLSRNSLTGRIPPGMGNIHQLAYFNVSYNHLFGAIPTGGQFNTFIYVSLFQNNTGLCGFPLQPCQSHPPGVQTESPESTHHDSWKQKSSHWISLDAFLVGLCSGFGTVALTFLLSRGARNRLLSRKVRRVHYCNQPYGAYKPR